MTMLDSETRIAITDLNARFAWALDLHDYEALRELLFPDVHYVGSSGRFESAEAVIASFTARSDGRTTRHALGNLLLTPSEEGVRGRSTWHTFASNDDPPQGVGVWLVADFHDVYATGHDGRWRIRERIIRPIFRDPTRAPLNPVGPDAPSEGGLT